MTTKAQTIDAIITRLNELTAYDPESAHGEADSLLLDALVFLGAHKVASAFLEARDRCRFWYA